jgi:NitT/TauT family transport system substrate-binding protein
MHHTTRAQRPNRASACDPRTVVGVVLLLCVLAACAPSTAAPSAPPAKPPAAAGAPAAPQAPAAPTARPAPVVFKLTTPSESTATLPITVAQRQGYYADEGIEVETLQMPPAVGMAAVLAGEVHYTSGATSALSAAATGAPVRLVYATADKPSHVLVGARGMVSGAELRGGVIATSSPGGVQYREAQTAVRHFGLDPQSVTLVSMATDPLRQVALENGAAQAAVLTVPFNIKLERDGYPRLLNYAEGDLVRIPVGGLSTTLDYLARNEDVVVRTLRGTLRGQRDTRENRPVAVAALMDFYSIDEPTAASIYDAAAPTYLPDGRMPVSVIMDTLESADESARNADPNTLVDFRYLERATQTLADQGRAR